MTIWDTIFNTNVDYYDELSQVEKVEKDKESYKMDLKKKKVD